MKLPRGIAFAFGLFGCFAIVALWTYMELSNYTKVSEFWFPVVLLACPANIVAGFILFDVEQGTGLMVLGWLFQAALNAGFYYLVGTVAAKQLSKKPVSASP
jgi:hypothetical protein